MLIHKWWSAHVYRTPVFIFIFDANNQKALHEESHFLYKNGQGKIDN